MIDCNKCIHQDTEECDDCPVSYDEYAQCQCHCGNPPCGFCETCKYEEK